MLNVVSDIFWLFIWSKWLHLLELVTHCCQWHHLVIQIKATGLFETTKCVHATYVGINLSMHLTFINAMYMQNIISVNICNDCKSSWPISYICHEALIHMISFLEQKPKAVGCFKKRLVCQTWELNKALFYRVLPILDPTWNIVWWVIWHLLQEADIYDKCHYPVLVWLSNTVIINMWIL